MTDLETKPTTDRSHPYYNTSSEKIHEQNQGLNLSKTKSQTSMEMKPQNVDPHEVANSVGSKSLQWKLRKA